MADLYPNFAAMAAANTRGVDYEIAYRPGTGTGYLLHIAIHGGGIESPTTQLAQYCAGNTGAYYTFSALKPSGNQDLHVTATHFDEPTALALAADSSFLVSWHGISGTVPVTYVGGADTGSAALVTTALEAAGFPCATPSADIAGLEPLNICNRNRRQAGVQLEITTAQRQAMYLDGSLTNANVVQADHRTQTFYRYADAVISAMTAATAPPAAVPREPSGAPGALTARRASLAVQMAVPFTLDASGAVAVVQDEAKAVSDRVRALVGTLPGDRVMRADYGVRTTDVLFAPDTESADAELQLMVRDAVAQWEPTAVINTITSSIDPDLGMVNVAVGVGRADIPEAEEPAYKTITVHVGGSVTDTAL